MTKTIEIIVSPKGETTVTTKGFTFTAKAIRVADDGKVVTFFVVD